MLYYVNPSHDGRLVSFRYYVTRKFVVYFVRLMMAEKQQCAGCVTWIGRAENFVRDVSWKTATWNFREKGYH